jgi:hypothetical protein
MTTVGNTNTGFIRVIRVIRGRAVREICAIRGNKKFYLYFFYFYAIKNST